MARSIVVPPEAGEGPARPRSFPAALACAVRGVRSAVRRQSNLRAHIAAAGLVLLGGALLGLSGVELAVLTAAVGLVLSAELLNTSIEMLADVVCPAEDLRAGAVKDVSAAGVLVASAAAAALAVFVLLPHVWGAPVAARLAAALGVACLVAFAGVARAAGRGRR